jgi:phospholipid/cholesterol/gamma-HCH transport system substrate-binding protein
METRGRHVLIGSFLLLMVAALFAFIIWMVRLDSGSAKEYDIFFRGAVTGLANGGAVQFNGVPIGQVRKIALVESDPGLVRVRISVDGETPILKGTTAVLDTQGFTGVAFVQLQGGYKGQPPLEKLAGQDVAVIPTTPSALQSLFMNAPQLLEQASVAITRITILLNEENRKNIGATLANVNKLTKGLSESTPDLQRAISSLEGTMGELRTASQSVRQLADTTNTTVSTDLPPLMADLRGVAQRMRKTADNLDVAVTAARPGIDNFSETTVPEVNRLIVDLRNTARSLQTATEKFEGGPAQALFGNNKVPEYDPSKK